MRIPKDLVPQKAVAEDLCVSLVTLWRARRSGLSDFPEPVVLRNMIFWKKQDLQQLEDALLRFEGRGKFEADRIRAQRNEALLKKLPAVKHARRSQREGDRQQLDLF